MSPIEEMQISRLLEGAAKLTAKAPYCWLITASGERANARPMGRLPPPPDLDDWKVRFVTDGRSVKAAEIRQASRVDLIFQNDADEAFATLAGDATLMADPAEIASRWKARYDAYFPTADDRANATFIEVAVDRMKLWIRGVTPEPFGITATVLDRETGGAWRMSAS
jgi:general stress protein 26